MTPLAALVALAKQGWSIEECLRAIREARAIERPQSTVREPANADAIVAAWVWAFGSERVTLASILRPKPSDAADTADLLVELRKALETDRLSTQNVGQLLGRCKGWRLLDDGREARLVLKPSGKGRFWLAEIRESGLEAA